MSSASCVTISASGIPLKAVHPVITLAFLQFGLFCHPSYPIVPAAGAVQTAIPTCFLICSARCFLIHCIPCIWTGPVIHCISSVASHRQHAAWKNKRPFGCVPMASAMCHLGHGVIPSLFNFTIFPMFVDYEMGQYWGCARPCNGRVSPCLAHCGLGARRKKWMTGTSWPHRHRTK